LSQNGCSNIISCNLILLQLEIPKNLVGHVPHGSWSRPHSCVWEF